MKLPKTSQVFNGSHWRVHLITTVVHYWWVDSNGAQDVRGSIVSHWWPPEGQNQWDIVVSIGYQWRIGRLMVIGEGSEELLWRHRGGGTPPSIRVAAHQIPLAGRRRACDLALSLDDVGNGELNVSRPESRGRLWRATNELEWKWQKPSLDLTSLMRGGGFMLRISSGNGWIEVH
ncbi:hypothetical protein K438DRAFT_1762851 [Mycena galopus ATCC 62051]|nr:hypothetical protein K438DRAFT_1762851 [Mycena galopus ATCC 62051]